MPRDRQRVLQPKLASRKEQSSRDASEDPYVGKTMASPLPTKSLLNGIYNQPSDKEVIVMKGLLWVQQDKLFSKWKERFIVLTSHYLQFFKKASSRISEMGAFVMKVKLGDMSSLSLEDRRGYLTLVIFCQKEGRLVVRKTEGIREWHDCLELFLARSKTAEGVKMESTEKFWDRAIKSDEVKSRDSTVSLHSHRNLPIKSPLMVKSLPTLSHPSNIISSSLICSRSVDEDSGLESMKTSTSDSGSSSLHVTPSSGPLEDAPGKISKYATGDDSSYHMLDKEEHEARNIRKEKHERGVSMAEYSKFRAKLPFITP